LLFAKSLGKKQASSISLFAVCKNPGEKKALGFSLFGHKKPGEKERL